MILVIAMVRSRAGLLSPEAAVACSIAAMPGSGVSGFSIVTGILASYGRAPPRSLDKISWDVNAGPVVGPGCGPIGPAGPTGALGTARFCHGEGAACGV